MQLFDPPTAVDEFPSEIVEQLGMRRRRTVVPEIIRCVYQTVSEMMLPESIGHDTRRERMR